MGIDDYIPRIPFYIKAATVILDSLARVFSIFSRKKTQPDEEVEPLTEQPQ